MGSEVLRIATREWVGSERAEAGTRRRRALPRLRAEHWIVAFWLVVGVLGYRSLAAHPPDRAAVAALDGGITPPRAH